VEHGDGTWTILDRVVRHDQPSLNMTVERLVRTAVHCDWCLCDEKIHGNS
jgi:hypothetical protein